MHDFKARFGWGLRLHRGAEFKAVFADKRYRPIRTPMFNVYRRPNDCGHPRLGLAVSRKAAKKAVDRNRIKRSIRESFRQQVRVLPDVDFVVTCSGRSDLKTSEEASAMLLQIWREAARRG